LFESFYFVMTTMATIGFWDITPQTDLWKVLVIIYAFLWVPLFISISWLRLESKFNKRIKWYVTKVYKEVHTAEEELKQIESKINKELDNVIQEAETTEEKIEDASKEIKSTNQKIDKMEKEIKKDQISRWKKILLRK
jgi:peptidoglycan hydrolase CwlO-like protein